MFNYWKFVNIYHNFKSNLLWRHISSIGKCLPSDMQTNRQIFFSQIFQNPWKRRKKNTCQKNYWAVRTPPLYFDKMSKKKKWKKERKIPKQNLWILIDMKKTKTCSKTRKNKQQWYIIVWQTNFFAFCFLLKKWPPMAILFRPLWQIMIIITPFPPPKKMTPNSQWISFSFSSSKTDLKKRIIPYITYHSRSSLTSHIIHT